jgi:hypothetical protein
MVRMNDPTPDQNYRTPCTCRLSTTNCSRQPKRECNELQLEKTVRSGETELLLDVCLRFSSFR